MLFQIELLTSLLLLEPTTRHRFFRAGKHDSSLVTVFEKKVKYRKLGLVQRCLQALIAELRSRAKNGVLRLWVHAIEECTRTY